MILMELETTELSDEDREEMSPTKYVSAQKERVLTELVGLLEVSGRIGNRGKLIVDFVNREKKASCGLAHGVAIPHVRSIHAKEFLLGFARSTPGLAYDCLDDEPAHLFFVMAAPPYDDTSYLRIYKQLAEVFSGRDVRQAFMDAESPGEILRTFKSFQQG
jgi:mannitol/fructose-specific phosphotransferase system IIA component (Ntr-type)